jgi:predicted ATPase
MVTYPGGNTETLQLSGVHSTIPHSMQKRGDARLAALVGTLRSTPKYSLVPQRVAEPCQLVEQAELLPDGFGLASCLDNLHNSDPGRFAKIEDALRLFVPGVEMVRFPPAGPGQKTILFHEKTGAKVYASEASHGLLLFLAHLTVAYAHGDVGVVLIEEPENAVHPRRLRDIVHLLRAICRGELGLPPVQVIATSHSPFLLNWCSKEEVTLFLRDEAGEVRTTPLAAIPGIDERIEDFASLGEFIYTVGEQACASRS